MAGVADGHRNVAPSRGDRVRRPGKSSGIAAIPARRNSSAIAISVPVPQRRRGRRPRRRSGPSPAASGGKAGLLGGHRAEGVGRRAAGHFAVLRSIRSNARRGANGATSAFRVAAASVSPAGRSGRRSRGAGRSVPCSAASSVRCRAGASRPFSLGEQDHFDVVGDLWPRSSRLSPSGVWRGAHVLGGGLPTPPRGASRREIAAANPAGEPGRVRAASSSPHPAPPDTRSRSPTLRSIDTRVQSQAGERSRTFQHLRVRPELRPQRAAARTGREVPSHAAGERVQSGVRRPPDRLRPVHAGGEERPEPRI